MINNTGLRIILFFVFLSTVYGYLSDDDYHKMLDGPHIIQYNCNMLIGGWHPDASPKILEECRKKQHERYQTQSNQK